MLGTVLDAGSDFPDFKELRFKLGRWLLNTKIISDYDKCDFRLGSGEIKEDVFETWLIGILRASPCSTSPPLEVKVERTLGECNEQNSQGMCRHAGWRGT